MSRNVLYIIIAVVVILIVLWILGVFGGADPVAETADEPAAVETDTGTDTTGN